MPIHKSWRKMYNNMVNRYGDEKGKQVFYAKLNKHKLKDTEPMPKHLSKEFVEDLFESMIELGDPLDTEEDENIGPISGSYAYNRWLTEINRSVTYWGSRRLRSKESTNYTTNNYDEAET